jgi:hydrogenase/urease accessory protein HupE
MEGIRMSSASRSRLPIYAFVVFSLLMCASPAEAHLNTTGMGPIYDGLIHFLVSPEDLVPVLALALLAGLRGAAHGRRALFTIPGAWLIGGLAGIGATAKDGNPFVSAVWFLLLGGLLASDAKLSLRVMTTLATSLGLYHGYLNGTGMGQPATACVALLGLVFAVFVLVALVAALVTCLRAQWTHVVVRVAGSWIAASGLLMLGWAVRTNMV